MMGKEFDDLFSNLSISRKPSRYFRSTRDVTRVPFEFPSLEFLDLLKTEGRGRGGFSDQKTLPANVPDSMSKAKYMRVMRDNLEAEYSHAVDNGYFSAVKVDTDWHHFNLTKDSLLNVPDVDFEKESWSQHLVMIEGSKKLAWVAFSCKDGLSVRSSESISAQTGMIKSIGYFGSFVVQFRAILELESRAHFDPLLDRIVSPKLIEEKLISSTLVNNPIDKDRVPCNDSQAAAVTKLRPGLDVIHGPPGTGKSTTVWHIINSRLQSTSQVLITCTRNQAVDAIVSKVANFGVLVFGNEDRLGAQGKKYTLQGRLKSDSEIVFWNRVCAWIDRMLRQLSDFTKDITNHQLRMYPGMMDFKLRGKHTTDGPDAKARWAIVLEKVFLQVRLKKHGLTNLTSRYKKLLWDCKSKASAICLKSEELRKAYILGSSRVYLCTIDSTGRMVAQLNDHDINLVLDTCIVDEAGCVLESAIPILLRFNPKNMFLIGDHQQLQPFSSISGTSIRTNHARSLLERIIDAGVSPWLLSIQFRMHPEICSIVSSCFYKGRLTSDQSVSSRSASIALPPVAWIESDSSEVAHQGRGYSNPGEATDLLQFADKLYETLEHSPMVYIITFYNKQKFELLDQIKRQGNFPKLERELRNERLHVLSIDACQGTEADYVLISTVRSKYITGFMEDKRRLCVAFSRAKFGCYVVGNSKTCKQQGSNVWKMIVRHYQEE